MELGFDEFLQIVDTITNQELPPEVINENISKLYQFRVENAIQFFNYSSQIVHLEKVSDTQATIAIAFIKSILRLSQYYGTDAVYRIWISIPEIQRTQLKQFLMRAITFPKDELRNISSSTLAIIAQIEFPLIWPDFFNSLLNLCKEQSFESSTIFSVLQTLGDAFTINFIRPRYTRERDKAFDIVFTLFFEAFQQDFDLHIKKAAVNMLINALKTTFYRNFRSKTEIIEKTFQHLLDNFEVEDEFFHQSIYEFFYISFKFIYDKMFPHPITEIAQAVTRDLQSGNSEYQKMSLSFLSKCAKLENEFIKEGVTKNDSPFIETCSQYFTESIMHLLACLDEDYNEDENESLSHYTYHTLKSFLLFDRKNVIDIGMEYFNQNKEDEDWRVRCSSILALKAITSNNFNDNKIIWDLFSDIVTLSQDPVMNVRLYSQSLIASLVKKYPLMKDSNEENQFIVDFCTELFQQDMKQSMKACKIIKNFIKRYDSNDKASPLGNDEIYITLLKALWSQVDRPEIQEQKFNGYVTSAINTLISHSPFSTCQIRKDFSIEVLERFRENAISTYDSENISQEITTIQSLYLEIFGSTIFSIRGFIYNDENFINGIFEFLIQYLPRMTEIPNLIKTIGNLILSAPEQSNKYAETLVQYLIEAQTSRNFDLITESSITMGDVFRTAPELMQQFSDTFCSLLLDNIEDDILSNASICQSILTLGDIVKRSNPESIIKHRDRLMNIVHKYTNIRYDPEDQGDVEVMIDFFEGTIYLAGAILQTFQFDKDFINNRNNIEILFEFRDHIKPSIFSSAKLDYSIILFLNCALDNIGNARKYNIFLNHVNIKNYLKGITDNSKNKDCVKRAKILLTHLISV